MKHVRYRTYLNAFPASVTISADGGKTRGVQSVRFELTHPKIVRPERTALDLSAKIASVTSKIQNVYNLPKPFVPPNLRHNVIHDPSTHVFIFFHFSYIGIYYIHRYISTPSVL